MALDQKDKELAAIGASIGTGCLPCIEHHIPAGRDAGLTEPELARAAGVADATHRIAAELLFGRCRELLHGPEAPAGVPLQAEPASRPDELVALGASIGANCHPLLEQHIAGALKQGLTEARCAQRSRWPRSSSSTPLTSPPVKPQPSLRQPGSIQRLSHERPSAGNAIGRDREEKDDHRRCGLRGGAGRTSPLRAGDTRARHEAVPSNDEQVPGNVRPASRSSGGHGLQERDHAGPRAGSGRRARASRSNPGKLTARRRGRSTSHGMAPRRYLLRAMPLRRGLPLHHVSVHGARRRGALPHGAGLSHRLRRDRRRRCERPDRSHVRRLAPRHVGRQLAGRDVYGRRRLPAASRQARRALLRPARRTDGNARGADRGEAGRTGRPHPVRRRWTPPPGADRGAGRDRDRGFRSAAEPRRRGLPADGHIAPRELDAEHRPGDHLALQRLRAQVLPRGEVRAVGTIFLGGVEVNMEPGGSAFAPTVLHRWGQHQNLLPGLALAALAAAGWIYVAYHPSATGGTGSMARGGPGGGAVFLSGWTAMMTAMMVPATLPLILLYRAIARDRKSPAQSRIGTMVLLTGYLGVWAAAGMPVYGYSLLAGTAGSLAAVLPASLLVAGGIYQFTPLKRIGHARCSSPLFFLLQNWRQGPAGALRLGVVAPQMKPM